MKNVTPEEWQRIDPILDGALELPPEKRATFLNEACAGDESLRKQVESMLGAGEVAGTFLEGAGPAELADMKKAVRKAAEEEDHLSGTFVGPYRLVRPIGKGGMGQVYLGMRDDESFSRHVAVKVIRRGMDTEEILHRFQTERRILASLTHPNISRLLDGGATDDGLSYFVMEYIQGDPITEYCDARNMSVRGRLQLFRKVCDAVQFAHRNLIVHRDLKPNNILVTPDGVPKLLDFGIAKVLNPGLAGYEMPVTRTEVRVMTPEYASPEQMRGAAVTTASDVYQLGVLLYELLTGGRPHQTDGRTRREIEDIVLRKEPDRPSTAISQIAPEVANRRTVEVSRSGRSPIDSLRRKLSGDLDRIVLMALRKEPDRRYASADHLQEDIRRHLEGLPVSAQADTLGYRVSKFVQRHKIGVAASAALALLLVAVTVLAIRFAVVTDAQSDRIALSAAKTEQVTRFLVSTFAWANPEFSRGRDITVKELMDRAVGQIDQELAGQPALQSHMLTELGVAYREVGDMETASRLLERGLAMRRGDPETLPLDLAASLFELGTLATMDGSWDRAEPVLNEALDIRTAEVGPEDPLIAETLNELAAIWAYTGRPEEAEEMFREAMRINLNAYDGPNRNRVELTSNLAWLLHDKGLETQDPAILDEAERQYRVTLDMKRTLMGDDHPYVGTSLNNLGSLMQDTQRYSEAEALHREALELRQRLYGDEHYLVANSMSQVGRALFGQERMDEAEPLLREAFRRHLTILGPNHPVVGRDQQVLASLLAETGQYDEADRLLTEAFRVFSAAMEPDHPWVQQAESLREQIEEARLAS